MSGELALSKLSVVVIGRNEERRLGRCLESVLSMQGGAWAVEVIYVDSGSSDGSVALAQGLGAHVIALQSDRPTAAMGRNAGWRAAGGEVVLCLDGDTVLDATFVRDSIGALGEAKIAAVWGHRREIDTAASIYNRVLDLDWIYAPGLTPFCGGDALFRRDVLAEVGGFDETLIAGEEPELCRRIIAAGYGIRHVDHAMTGHDLGIREFGAYWRRAVRAGHAFAEVAQRFAKTDSPFWSAEIRRNRLRALGLLGLVFVGIAVSVVTRSVWGVLGVVGLLGLVVLRTAWKARWKSNDAWVLLMYGVHSQFQQLPIFWGQMTFAWNQRRGRRMGIVEYKRS